MPKDKIPDFISEVATSVDAAKPLDADITHLLETLEMDEEFNTQCDCGDGELSQEASRLVATARRLVREAGYALPETVGGAS